MTTYISERDAKRLGLDPKKLGKEGPAMMEPSLKRRREMRDKVMDILNKNGLPCGKGSNFGDPQIELWQPRSKDSVLSFEIIFR